MRNSLLLTLSVLISLAAFPALAAQGGGSTCYNCDNFGGSWSCSTSSLWGGTSCTLGQDTCSVSGNCADSSGGGVAPAIYLENDTIRQIAVEDIHAAASLVRLTRSGQIPLEGTIYWHAAPMNLNDLEQILEGGVFEGRASGQKIGRSFSVIELDPSTLVLSIGPGPETSMPSPIISLLLERGSNGFELSTWFVD